MEDDIILDLMDQENLEDVLAFLERCDTGKPLPVNKIVVPQQLIDEIGYEGTIYGYIRKESGYHVILGWDGNLPVDELKAEKIGYIGQFQEQKGENYIVGTWEGNDLHFVLYEEGAKEVALETDIYTMKQDAFSRNTGLLETNWMDDQCAVICGCGSVGSCVALELARSGVGKFVLVDTDCVEIPNISRHQCNLTDVGRYKVDAVAERILQINPMAKIKKFYQRIQEVRKEAYEEWILPGKALFIGASDNRLGKACACDLACEFGVAFASLGFMTRAWAGEIYVYLPERNDICYRCAFRTQIDNSIEEERRNHFYIGEEHLAKASFVPGLDVDLEFGTSLFDKVVLDILNRNNTDYRPRILHKMTQYMIFSGTDDRSYANEFWKQAFPTPIALRSLRHSEDCRRCEYCLAKKK